MDLTSNIDGQTYRFKLARIQAGEPLEEVEFYFAKYLVVPNNGGEILIGALSERVSVTASTIQNSLDALQVAAFTELQQKLDTASEIEIPNHPKYLDFYNALLISNVFQFARQQATQSLANNAAYTDFSDALGLCVTGQGNPLALQSATNNLIAALALPPDSPLLAEAQSLIDQFNIPIALTQS